MSRTDKTVQKLKRRFEKTRSVLDRCIKKLNKPPRRTRGPCDTEAAVLAAANDVLDATATLLSIYQSIYDESLAVQMSAQSTYDQCVMNNP